MPIVTCTCCDTPCTVADEQIGTSCTCPMCGREFVARDARALARQRAARRHKAQAAAAVFSALVAIAFTLAAGAVALGILCADANTRRPGAEKPVAPIFAFAGRCLLFSAAAGAAAAAVRGADRAADVHAELRRLRSDIHRDS